MIEIENYYPEKVKSTVSTNVKEEEHEEIEEHEEHNYIEEQWTNKTSDYHRGFSISIPDERHYGRCTPFMYYNGEPLILIGPDCRSCVTRGVLSWPVGCNSCIL